MIRQATKLVIVITALYLTGCLGTLSGGPVRGQVIDASTRRPLAGAIVVVRWEGNISGSFVDSKTVCYHVETTTTNADGNYDIPRWSKTIVEDWEGGIFGKDYQINAYKPSYQWAPIQPGARDIIFLQPFGGTVEERIKSIWSSGVMCTSAGESKKNLLPLYRGMYEESNRLAVSAEDRKYVNAILNIIDTIELPYEEALKREIQRAKEQ